MSGIKPGQMFFSTLRRMLFFFAAWAFIGVLLATLTWFLLPQNSLWVRAAASAAAFCEVMAAAITLGWQWSLVIALKNGMTQWRPAGFLLNQLFSAMRTLMGEDSSGLQLGEQTLRKIPLSQAERLLHTAALKMTGGEAVTSLRKGLRTFLLRRIEFYTLSRFRLADTSGIDLDLVQKELEESIDDKLLERLQGAAVFWTWIVALVVPVIVLLQAWGVSEFLR